MTSEDQLEEIVDRVARGALHAFQSADGPEGSHDDHLAAVRAAIWEHADAGTFGAWGVTSRADVPRLAFVVGYSPHVERFLLNPTDIALQIVRAGWRARDRAGR